MKPSRLRSCYKFLSVTGCFLLFFPYGQTFFWGNMYIYCMSYLINLSPSHSADHAPWVLTMKMCFTAITTCGTGFLVKITGKRPLLALGIVLTSASYFLTYFAVQNSNLLFILCFGVLYGTADGIVFSISLQYAVAWAGDKDGLYTAIARSGQYVGAIFTNLFVSWYINPHNSAPDTRIGPSMFFTQPEIIEKVPATFLVLGTVCSLCQFSGFVMVRENNTLLAGDDSPDKKEGYGTIEAPNSQEVERDEEKNTNSSNNYIINNNSNGVGATVQSPIEIQRHEEEINNDMTPRQMVSTLLFYILFFTFMTNIVTYIAMNQYYKSFGEMWIGDDFFLTTIGTAIPITTVFSALLWGMFIDKFDVKATLILLNALLFIFGSFYYFTPQLSVWFFCVATILFGGIVCPVIGVYNAATAKLFGKTNYGANLGIMTLSMVAINLILAPILEALLVNLGWSYLFMIPASTNAVSLVVVLINFKK